MRGRPAVAASVAALALVACGQGDDSQSFRPPAEKPPLTVPGESATQPADEPRPQPASPAAGGGADAAPPAESPDPAGEQASPPATTPPPPDAPDNDLPPPPGSAAERFERACQEDPGVCR